MLTCIAPPADSSLNVFMYTLVLDGAVFIASTDPELIIQVRPNPRNFTLATREILANAIEPKVTINVSCILRKYLDIRMYVCVYVCMCVSTYVRMYCVRTRDTLDSL